MRKNKGADMNSMHIKQCKHCQMHFVSNDVFDIVIRKKQNCPYCGAVIPAQFKIRAARLLKGRETNTWRAREEV